MPSANVNMTLTSITPTRDTAGDKTVSDKGPVSTLGPFTSSSTPGSSSSGLSSRRKKRHGQNHFLATLELGSVRKSQSGNYSCSPSNSHSASVRLHVIDGETLHTVIVGLRRKG